MDADGAFGTGVESPADDPFAQTDEEFRQEDPLADPEAASLPLVDKEGQVISDNGTAIPVSEEEMLAEADRLREEQAVAEAGDPEPEANGQEELAVSDPHRDAGGGGGPTDAAKPDPTGAAESVAAQPPPGTTSDAAESASTAPAASPAASSAEPGEADGSDDAPEAEVPEEVKDKKGAVTHRRYALFQPDGEGKWSEVHWHEKDGKIVKKGTPGAKKQKVCLARGQEEALAIGFAAMGSPSEGAPLVAVALTYWQLRHVAPDPVQPIRQRLSIR